MGCMGNSFPNLMDEEGDLRNQKIAIKNFYDMLKPGGILIIDHRNYDYILKHGKSPNKNIYYNSSIYKVVTKTIYEDGKAKQIILDYRKMEKRMETSFSTSSLTSCLNSLPFSRSVGKKIVFALKPEFDPYFSGSFWNPTT